MVEPNANEREDHIHGVNASHHHMPVGTIIASLLSPEQMYSEGGDLWVPADGRNALPAWRYTRLTGDTKLPDLRGMFLRGVNDSDKGVRTDGKQDPDDHRKPGSEQSDGLAAHGHPLSLKALGFAQDITGTPFGSNLFTEGGFNKRVDNAIENQPHATPDTRPRNVAVRWYIKVN